MHYQDSTHPTGVADTSPRGGSDVARARLRKANSAIALRGRGHQWDEIAELVGYPTARAALVATEKALEAELKTDESQVFMRSVASRRLDDLLASVWGKATDPDNPEHLQAMDRASRLIAQYAKLHGLDAPTEMVVSSPALGEIEKWVAEVVQHGSPVLEEDDIFDAELVPELEAGHDAP